MTFQHFLAIAALFIPLFHGMGFLLAAHAILFARTSQAAIAWALSLIFFPYLSIVLYLVFGRKKFIGYIEARRTGDRHIDHLADNLVVSLKPEVATLHEHQERFAFFNRLAMVPFTMGNRARLLIDGAATFEAIFAAIDRSSAFLLVQFFIIRDDELGKKLQSRLIQKAQQGVKVYLLYDEIGCLRLPGRFINELRAAGVRVNPFNTRRGWRNRFQINFRNHRKIVVADGRVAYVGGHNVGDEYLGKSPRFGRWRDTHVEVTGPAVAAVQWSFIEDWHWATGEVLEFPPPAGSPAIAEPAAGGESALTSLAQQAPAGIPAVVIPTAPADDLPNCTLMFLGAITVARKRLWIASPYFVPEEAVYDALQLAALRGVDVRILLPSKPDHILVYLSSFSYLESAEQVGVKFYRYCAGFLHQKVMLIDDDLAAVGTANLDNRSMRLNFELTLMFADKDFAREVATMLDIDFRHSERATRGDLGRRSIAFRVAVRISRLLSPVQ